MPTTGWNATPVRPRMASPERFIRSVRHNKMNEDQRKTILSTADTIGDHLAWAWNYIATLRALQRHARRCPEVFDKHAHFVSTLTYSIWDALFLKLNHCTDKRKEAIGFPRLFKQIRKYLEPQAAPVSKIDDHEGELDALRAKDKVANWRNRVVAHYTLHDEHAAFFEDNVCSFDEIEELISRYQKLLNFYAFELFDMQFMVKDFGPKAHEAIDQVFAALCAEQGHEEGRS